MTQHINNYLKILSYLKEYEGDEEYHEIEHVLVGINDEMKHKVFRELAKEGFVKLNGGPAPVYSVGKPSRDNYGSRQFSWQHSTIGESTPYKGKITFKGSKHLREELQMTNDNKVNINVGNYSTANLILHSPNSKIHNKVQSQENIQKIIETLKNDETLDIATKNTAVATFELLQYEVEAGNPTQDTWNKALTVGASIASVGSLVLALIQQFVK